MDKVKNMDKAKVLYELDRLSRLTKTHGKDDKKLKEKKRPDYSIFEKPEKVKGKKPEDIFSLDFLEELKDYLHDHQAKKILINMINNKKINYSDSESSSDED
jgi:hypothetical protein